MGRRSRRPDHGRLYDTAASQAGYFTRAQARACGFSDALIHRHVESGRFIRIRRGLYRLRWFPDSPGEELAAVLLALGPQAVVSHESALGFHRLSDVVPSAVHVTVPRGMRWAAGRTPPGVVLHTARAPVPEEDVIAMGALRVTRPTRSIVDAAEYGTAPEQIALAVRQALRLGLATVEELRRAAAGRVHRNWISALSLPLRYGGLANRGGTARSG
jgi:predicted transcriptional regulator of viral defense system